MTKYGAWLFEKENASLVRASVPRYFLTRGASVAPQQSTIFRQMLHMPIPSLKSKQSYPDALHY